MFGAREIQSPDPSAFCPGRLNRVNLDFGFPLAPLPRSLWHVRSLQWCGHRVAHVELLARKGWTVCEATLWCSTFCGPSLDNARRETKRKLYRSNHMSMRKPRRLPDIPTVESISPQRLVPLRDEDSACESACESAVQTICAFSLRRRLGATAPASKPRGPDEL